MPLRYDQTWRYQTSTSAKRAARLTCRNRDGFYRNRLVHDQWQSNTGTTIQRAGQSAAIMSALRAPQSKPARITLSIFSASMKLMTSTATTDGCPRLRGRMWQREKRLHVTK